MYNKLLVFFANVDNAAVWAAFARLVTEIAKFVGKNADLDQSIQQQNQQTKGITTDKDNKFTDLVTLIVKYARKARIWALDNNNADLEKVFDIQKDDYTKIAEDLAFNEIINVRDALNANIGSLGAYNVIAANITQIDAAITAYNDAEGTPGAAKGKKEVGTKGIEIMMSKIDTCLENIDDLLVHEYFDTNRELVEEYKKDRKIETVGVHHTHIIAHITYADGTGNAQGVLMKVVELNKKATSDIDGIAESPNFKAGTWHIEFSGSNIQTKSIIQKVKRGQTVHLDMQVDKK